MGAVNTNSVSLAIAEEDRLGVVAHNAVAEYMEPNEIGDYGSDITTVARNPISKDRQNRKGAITDVSSAVNVTMDTTASHLLQLLPGAMFSTWYDKPHWLRDEVSATATGFAVTGSVTGVQEGDLLFARGFKSGANNGLFVVDSISGQDITVVSSGVMVQENGDESTSLYLVGHQFDAGDVSVDGNGNLTSTTADFSKLGLVRGQAIFVGGLTASSAFDTEENHGLARVQSIAAHLLSLDKRQQAYRADDGAGKTIQLFYGWFLRNVPQDHTKFKEHYYQFELTYPNLMTGDKTGYEYATGNLINTLELSMPLSDKSTVSVETFGKDVEDITETRKAWKFLNPMFTEAFSTTSDFLRLRIQSVDDEGLTTLLKEATLNINNNASGENVLAKLGPEFVNYGNFDVTLEMTAVFTNPVVVSKIRNNCTVTADFCLVNNDAGFYFDIPNMTLGDGSRDFTVNEKIKIALSSNAFGDASLGYTLSQTFFPYLPVDKAAVCN